MSNIALVVLDTLRKDSFDEQFDWLPGIRFENAWSTSGWTVPVHGSLFGGRYPSEMGVYAKTTSLDCEQPVLAERLSEAGYTTRGFSANANIADVFQFTRGFDEFQHSWRGTRRNPDVLDWAAFISETDGEGSARFFRAVKRCFTEEVDTFKSLKLGLQMKARDLGIEHIAGADDGAREALKLIRETNFGDREFFFMNLMEAHGPYNPPQDYRTTDCDVNPDFDNTVGDPPEDTEGVRQAYEDCVRYLSDIYEEIHGELAKDFDYIITIADHGEMFGEYSVWGHNYAIAPELVHVPLSIYRSEDERTVKHETVSLLSVYRTVLDCAGLQATDPDARGSNLLDGTESERYLVERHGLRTERLNKLQNKGYDPEVIEQYDVKLRGGVMSGYYGWESRDGFHTSGDSGTTGEARACIDQLSSTLDSAEVSLSDDKDLPEDVTDRLEDLGYM